MAPSHYLNQCWKIVNRTPKNKLQWNLNRNSYIFIQWDAFKNVVCKMVSISSRPQWVKVPPNHMIMPLHGNTFHIMGFLFGESTSYQWIALTKPRASSTRLWCLLCCWPEKNCWTNNLPVIWDTMMTMWLHHDVGITSTTVKSLI